MGDLTNIFDYQGKKVRTVILENGDPGFVVKDVCAIFGDSNYRRSVLRLDDDEKGVSQVSTPGGKQEMTIVNEAGLYSLLFAMQPQKGNSPDEQIQKRIESLKQFKRWVTHEVLPAIRKHGIYATDNVIEKVLNNPDFGIVLLTQLKEERHKTKQLELENSQQNQIINELKPRADYTDQILKNKGLVTITQIAKDYGMSGAEMNKLLHDLKVQYKQSGQWLLYRDIQNKGYTHSETIQFKHKDGTPDVTMNTKWTQKGRLFLYNLLKQNGVLPVIERETHLKLVSNDM